MMTTKGDLPMAYYDIVTPDVTASSVMPTSCVVGFLYREREGTWVVGGERLWARTWTKRAAVAVALRTIPGGFGLRRVAQTLAVS